MSTSTSIESDQQRRLLLEVARNAAKRALLGDESTTCKPAKLPGCYGGAFVTFWSQRKLRGCVGTFASTTDIVATIEEVTLTSLSDSRFKSNPITAKELSSLNIEISVLSDAAPTNDPESLVPGTHGIVIRQSGRTGCFLPQVATERGWSAEELLSNCCTMKAGLDADAWRQGNTEVLLFTADAFSEANMNKPSQ